MPGTEPRAWQISHGGGNKPHWRKDGRELYFLGPDSRSMMAVDIDPGPPFHFGTPHQLFRAPLAITLFAINDGFDVTADGQNFLLALPPPETAASPINVVLNWQAALPK
jgi:hypothetical protein